MPDGKFATYKARDFDLSGLTGISDHTLEIHFKLYEGYVKETNNLNERLAELSKKGEVAEADLPAFAEIKRYLGFEYNGMVLHEYYFGNLKKNGGPGDPAKTSAFAKLAAASYGSYEAWKRDFVTVGKMRGVGWSICYQDPSTQRLSNHWITLHEDGNVAGFTPVLVMDVWEHAFILDYKPAERPKYIEAFFANVNWDTVAARLVANRLDAAR